MLVDLREGPDPEVILDPGLALVLETIVSCLRGRVDSPHVRDVGFYDEVVLDKGGDDTFAHGLRSMGPYKDPLSFAMDLDLESDLLGGIVLRWARHTSSDVGLGEYRVGLGRRDA